jgi:hypothetical protein
VPTLILAALSLLAAVASLIVTLQFLEVLPWDEDFDFWGGKWAGVLLSGFITGLALLVAYGWLTLKPWALMITLFEALLGFATPMMAIFAGTETLSTALGPLVLNALILILAMRPSVRRAIRDATVEASRPKPPPRPPAFRASDV